jgi:hypothetical protein
MLAKHKKGWGETNTEKKPNKSSVLLFLTITYFPKYKESWNKAEKKADSELAN